MAVALVSHTVAAPSTSGGTTSALDTTGATLLVAAVAAVGQPSSVSDSKGNTWTALTGYSGTFWVKVFYVANPTVGAGHTLTFSQASSFPAFVFAAFSGVKTTSPQDQLAGAGSVNPGSITPSEDNELLLTLNTHAAASAASASGYTTVDAIGFVGGVNVAVGLAYLVQTTAGASNPTWSQNSSPASTIASFKAAAGGGGVIGNPNAVLLLGGMAGPF